MVTINQEGYKFTKIKVIIYEVPICRIYIVNIDLPTELISFAYISTWLLRLLFQWGLASPVLLIGLLYSTTS